MLKSVHSSREILRRSSSKTPTLKSRLDLNQIALEIFLGWYPEEQKSKQEVNIDLAIEFSHTPEACWTDELEHAYCYDEIVKKIQAWVEGRRFKLVENLAYFIYSQIRTELSPPPSGIQVSVHKKNVPVPALQDGARFTIGDF